MYYSGIYFEEGQGEMAMGRKGTWRDGWSICVIIR